MLNTLAEESTVASQIILEQVFPVYLSSSRDALDVLRYLRWTIDGEPAGGRHAFYDVYRALPNNWALLAAIQAGNATEIFNLSDPDSNFQPRSFEVEEAIAILSLFDATSQLMSLASQPDFIAKHRKVRLSEARQILSRFEKFSALESEVTIEDSLIGKLVIEGDFVAEGILSVGLHQSGIFKVRRSYIEKLIFKSTKGQISINYIQIRDCVIESLILKNVRLSLQSLIALVAFSNIRDVDWSTCTILGRVERKEEAEYFYQVVTNSFSMIRDHQRTEEHIALLRQALPFLLEAEQEKLSSLYDLQPQP